MWRVAWVSVCACLCTVQVRVGWVVVVWGGTWTFFWFKAPVVQVFLGWAAHSGMALTCREGQLQVLVSVVSTAFASLASPPPPKKQAVTRHAPSDDRRGSGRKTAQRPSMRTEGRASETEAEEDLCIGLNQLICNTTNS